MNPIGLRYVISPAKPIDIIYRSSLCEKLHNNRSKSLIVLNTSAGYGKTILLCDYSEKFLKNVCWLNSPNGIDSPSELVLYMIYSVRQINSMFGDNIIDYISSLQSNDKKKLSADMVILFLNDFIKSFNEDVTIIIDDFQNFENIDNTAWIQIFFDELFTTLPPNLKFIISTRQTPCFKISRLEAKRNYLTLKTSDLEFGDDEIIILLSEIYGKKCTNKDAAEFKNLTQGWITALHLVLQSVNNSEELKSFEAGENFYNYFTEDIFNCLDEDVKTFLLSTAFLDSFTIDFCSKLLKISSASEILNKITSKNIFLDSFKKSDEVFYSYQKLFSDFLNEFRNKSLNANEIKNNYLQAAQIYEEMQDYEKAVSYYIKSGNVTNAIQIINDNFEIKIENSDYKTINCWFRDLTEKTIFSETLLLYNYVKFCIVINQLDRVPEKIEFLFKSISNKKEELLKCNLLNAEYELITGNSSESIKILEDPIYNNITGKLSAEYNALLAKTYYRMGFDSYDRLIQISEHILEIILKCGTPKQMQEVLGFIANIYADRDQKDLSIIYYEKAILIGENIISSFKIFSTLSLLYSDIGNFEKAQNYLEKVEKIYLNIPIPIFERYILRSKEKFYFNLGDYQNAILMLKLIMKNIAIKSNQNLMLVNLWFIVEAYYYLNKIDLARQNYELSLTYLNKNDNYFYELSKLYKNYYIADNIYNKETEDSLLLLHDLHIQKKVYEFVASLEYYLSNYYLLLGNHETSLEYLQKAMKTFSQKNDFVRCSSEFIITRHVFDFAIANNICKPFISKIFPFIQSKLDYDWIRPEFRIELTGKIDKLIDVKMESFGKTDFYLRGNVINNDKWIRKKSKILLAYLMSGYEKVYTKDKIMEMFFDDIPAEKADVMYHSTIYNIRTALKVYDLKAGKTKGSKQKDYDYNPEYILYEDKTLRLNPDFYYRSDNTEFEKLYSKAKLPADDQDAKINFYIQAVELYKGDFLPGYYDSWCEELREKYKNMFITLSEDLIKLLGSGNKNEEIIKFSERLLAEDPLNESAYISLTRYYSAQQNLNMARNIFSQMLESYDKELCEKPSDSTLQKINSILNNK